MPDDEPKRDAKGRWLPGVSGCPGGPNKSYRRMTDDLYRILHEVPQADELAAQFEALEIPEGVQAIIEMSGDRQEALLRALVYRAMTGNWRALEEIGGRLDPRPNAHQFSGPGGGPIVTAGLQLAGSSPKDAQAEYLALTRGEEVSNAEDADLEDDEHGQDADPGQAGA